MTGSSVIVLAVLMAESGHVEIYVAKVRIAISHLVAAAIVNSK